MRYAVLEPFGEAVDAHDPPGGNAAFACPADDCNAAVTYVQAEPPHFRHERYAPKHCIYRARGGGGGEPPPRWDLNIALSIADDLQLPLAATDESIEIAMGGVLALSSARWLHAVDSPDAETTSSSTVSANMLTLLRTASYAPFLRRCITGILRRAPNLLKTPIALADEVARWCIAQDWRSLWRTYWRKNRNRDIEFAQIWPRFTVPRPDERLVLQRRPACLTRDEARVSQFEHSQSFHIHVSRAAADQYCPLTVLRFQLTASGVGFEQSSQVLSSEPLSLPVRYDEAMLVTPAGHANTAGMRRALLYALPSSDITAAWCSKVGETSARTTRVTEDRDGNAVTCEYLVDQMDGKYEARYPTGKIKERGTYRDGQKVGEWQTYYAHSGKPASKSRWEAGMLHGRYVEWASDGTVIVDQMYEYGVLRRR